jgi:tripeptide aminopeptidase
VARATTAERERLNATFEQLCRIESPSGHERACADWITAELRGMGLEVVEDGAGAQAGSDAGNLFARIPGAAGAGSILLCAHMDTVPLADRVEPVLVDGGWENEGDGILGADNKSAVAILIELARRLTAAAEPPPVGVELLFTVCEEVSLQGSKAFDVSRLQSSFGYVFDHATPIGGLVVASPTHYRVIADVHGRAAHAGVRPEAGRSAVLAAARGIAAMTLGRVDEQTTANVGTIEGGSAINVIPERCRVVAEVRSLDEDRASAVATEMIDHLQDGADREECDLDLEVQRMFRGYRVKPGAPQLAAARRALSACGYEPSEIASGGASDVNSFQLSGFASMCLADGVQRNHEPTERVAVEALEGMFHVALTLLDEAAAELRAP